MAADDNHTIATTSTAATTAVAAVFNEEELDDDDDESEEEDDEEDEETETLTLTPKPPQLRQNDDVFDEDEDEDDEEEEELHSPSSSAAAGEVTVAVLPPPSAAAVNVPDLKRQHIDEPLPIVAEEKKPSIDESRRLFQRLWTDEDEIELLKGFFEYTTQRGSSQHHHHDTALFYDQIKGKFQLEFNKNQLVEKLRRLKKKYRNVVNRISSGKDFSFKSSHDQATFEISRKIWSSAGHAIATTATASTVAADDATFDEDDPNSNPNANLNNSFHVDGVDGNLNSSEKKTPQRSRKRSRAKSPEKHTISNNAQLGSTIPSLVEETVKSCLSPLFKELLQSAMGGSCGARGFGGVATLNPMPLSFGGPLKINFSGGDVVDEKWRKQQILELEVYSKRLELVQDQIKVALEELRSSGG